MDSLFSILISNHNRSKYLKECIESVLKQTYTKWEVIFVDDFSSDNSVQVFKDFTKNDNRFHLFRNEKNMGCGYTKKACVDYASGDICGFLDSDDALTPDALELMVKFHEEHPEVSIIGSRKYHCNENLKIKSVDSSLINEEKNFKSQLDNLFTINHFVSFKRNAYLKSVGINSELQKAVDQDLYYKLEEQGKVAFINKPLYFYRHNNFSISLHDNVYKADAWHLLVIYDTCKRRNLNFNDYCSLMKKTKSRKEKIINYLFEPYQILKIFFINKKNLLILKKDSNKNIFIETNKNE